ncbi:hypothetical protein BC628DRAFT_328990 [Trametes gibbosa]|nr:hypothetical protein BC628DRAFT_328990 [Trametes gibbosa]
MHRLGTVSWAQIQDRPLRLDPVSPRPGTLTAHSYVHGKHSRMIRAQTEKKMVPTLLRGPTVPRRNSSTASCLHLLPRCTLGAPVHEPSPSGVRTSPSRSAPSHTTSTDSPPCLPHHRPHRGRLPGARSRCRNPCNGCLSTSPRAPWQTARSEHFKRQLSLCRSIPPRSASYRTPPRPTTTVSAARTEKVSIRHRSNSPQLTHASLAHQCGVGSARWAKARTSEQARSTAVSTPLIQRTPPGRLACAEDDDPHAHNDVLLWLRHGMRRAPPCVSPLAGLVP